MESSSERFTVGQDTLPVPGASAPCIPDHELLRRIGGGSYGEVWLARSVLGHYRAVKLVRRSSFPEDRPFEREFEGLRRFEPVSRRYESQVDILQVGRTEDGFYYVMELADDAADGGGDSARSSAGALDPERYVSKTLKGEMRRRGRLPIEECQDIGLALATALQHLHNEGLVHRDVKPSNIIFAGGTPKLADIGLVTDIDATRSFVGTEGYIAPEGPGTPQADLYSLGKVLYEVCTGKSREEFPEPPADWGGGEGRRGWPEFFEVVLKACEPDPRRRHRSAREMRADLALLQSGKSVRLVHALERRLAAARRVGLLAGLLLLVVAAANLFVMRQREQVRAHAQRADREAERARQAGELARQEQGKANLAEARAWRSSTLAGRRYESLAALAKAAEIRRGLEVRNETIAGLALVDLHATGEHAVVPPLATFGGFDQRYERYAFGETNGDVVVCDVADHRELVRLRGFEPPFGFLFFSPDGQGLAIGSGAQHPCVEFRRLDSDAPLLRLAPADGRTLDFSPDGRRVAVSLKSPGSPIQVYDLASGQRLGGFAHDTLPWSIAFHPQQASWLLTSDQSPEVRLWDWTTGRTVSTFTCSNGVAGLSWHPEGRCFAGAGTDHRVWLWDTAASQPRALLAGHQWCVVNVTFTHDGRYLASRGWDNMLYLWDYAANREAVHLPISGFIYEFSRASYKMGLSLVPGDVGVFEVTPPLGYRLLSENLQGVAPASAGAFSPDGRLFVCAHGDRFRLWDAATGRLLAALPLSRASSLVAFSSDGKRLFTGAPGAVQARSFQFDADGETLALSDPQPVAPLSDGSPWSPTADGAALGFYSEEALRLLDLRTGQQQERPLSVNPDGLALNASGTRAATWMRNQTVAQVWDLVHSEKLREIRIDQVGRIVLSPDDQWLVVCGPEEYRVWDLTNWTLQYSLKRGVIADNGFMAFSPDSRTMAVTYTRSAVRLAEAATGRELATLQAPDLLDVNGIVFSPDGRRLAVLALAGQVQLWDLGLLRAELRRLRLDWD